MAAVVGVVVFPGSNCEHDAIEAVRGLDMVEVKREMAAREAS